MTRFDQALDIVLHWEGHGQVTDDPADPGGITRWGISLAFLRRADSDAGPADIREMTREHAATLYRGHFWSPIRADDLHPALALFTFDTAVNLGVPRAARLLQQAVGAAPDGVIGPRSIAAAAKAAAAPDLARAVLVDMCAGRMDIYVTRPGWPRFGRGWTRRVFDVALLAGVMYGG
ncbi:glycosyl hydrolase 108 family protein [Tistrella bauzanensis]|uniref:glycoside hydrolase family 108 protein n=1 Tax=Tistrella TaxID=171436 RepID=UPI0031F6C671